MTKEEMIEAYGQEYYTEHVNKMNEKNKARYQNDPVYRARQDARQKRLYKENEEYREAAKERQREKYQNDPVYRQKILDYMHELYLKKKAEKQKKAKKKKTTTKKTKTTKKDRN